MCQRWRFTSAAEDSVKEVLQRVQPVKQRVGLAMGANGYEREYGSYAYNYFEPQLCNVLKAHDPPSKGIQGLL